MSETPSDPETAPVVAEPAPAVVVEPQERKSNRLNLIAAGVGIAAGAVFIVAVIFGTGFWLGLHADKGGGGGGHHRGGPPGVVMHHPGPPMFPGMRPGPGMFPGEQGGPGGPGGPAGPGGPGGPGAERPPQPPTSGAPTPPR